MDADGNNASYNAATWANHQVWGNIADVTIDGQAMVKVPCFWFKVGTAPSGSDQAGKSCWWVSDAPVDGFSVHPAFLDTAGETLGQFYVGKYQASADSGKAQSISGVAPDLQYPQLGNAQTLCEARNVDGVEGFHLWSCYEVAAMQMLFLIEMGTPDAQSVVASGRVNQSAVANVDASDVIAAAYRGVLGLWGNVEQCMDGVFRHSDYTIKIWNKSGSREWVETGASWPYGYPVSVHASSGEGWDLRAIFAASSITSTAAQATWPDYHHPLNGHNNLIAHGGDYASGSYAGMWCWQCTGNQVGYRLAKI